MKNTAMRSNPLLINSQENVLEILVKPETIIYSIADDNGQVLLRQEVNILSGKSADIAVYEHFFNQPELQITSENTTIIFSNSQYQLVPSELFREQNMKLIFEVEHGALEDEYLKYLVLPKWSAHLVFAVPSKMMDFFKSKFPEAEIEHHVGNLLKRKIDKNANAVWAYLRNDAMDLLIVKDNQLHLLSSFEVKTKEDICYFILNAYEQLQLDTEKYTLNVLSEDIVNKDVVELLESYISCVNH